MPELPEVETVARGLAPVLVGRRLAMVEQRRPDLRVPFPPGFARRLTGRRVEALGRRAKYILATMDDGTVLIAHLGMSGRLRLGEGPPPPPGPHDHVVMATEDGHHVVYTDHRRFGLMLLDHVETLERHPLLARLGPEPLGNDFHAAALSRALAGKMTPIKSALLDQTVVAGLGNIYVCEALHRAGISPRRLAATVAGAGAARLVPAIRAVLTEAIEAGGSSLRDYVQASGELGYFQKRFAVYDRTDSLCPACAKGVVRRIVQAGRSTFYCERCQT